MGYGTSINQPYRAAAKDFGSISLRNAYFFGLGLHLMVFIWNPTIMPASQSLPQAMMMRVEFREALPPTPEVPKKEVRKPEVKKAKKSGLAMHKPAPIRAVKRTVKPARTPAAPPPSRRSAIKMPKIIPHATDEDQLIAAAPTRVAQATGLRRQSNPLGAPQRLQGRSRGVRASDVHFKLSDRGSLAGGGMPIAIPIGEEAGETALVQSAPMLRNAPIGKRHISGASFQAPMGEGVGVLSGKNRTGYVGAIQIGEPSDDEVLAVARSVGGALGGKGVEIGGPVGDRKILKRQLPEYPAWAEEKGVTAMVKIYFTVKQDGTIRRSLRVLQSSGYAELDSLAKEALRAWKFSPTEVASNTEAWGVITFRFTLA